MTLACVQRAGRAGRTRKRLAVITRDHWGTENRLYWVRDVTFDESRSTVRCGSTPQVMAALRSKTIALTRLAGHINIAAACRLAV